MRPTENNYFSLRNCMSLQLNDQGFCGVAEKDQEQETVLETRETIGRDGGKGADEGMRERKKGGRTEN